MAETSDSFITLFLNSALNAEGGFLSFLSLFFLFMARFLPIILQSPFFGARLMPQPAKVALAYQYLCDFFTAAAYCQQ